MLYIVTIVITFYASFIYPRPGNEWIMMMTMMMGQIIICHVHEKRIILEQKDI